MKIIGLLGGMTCESTVIYYQIINRNINDQLGKDHSAKIILYSVDLEEIEVLVRSGQWDAIGAILGEAASKLEGAGADFLVLCTNTMHKVVSIIETHVHIPILHIVDVTAEAIAERGFHRIGLIGTQTTMVDSFYRARLETKYGIEAIVPPEKDREIVHRVIVKELGFGNTFETSRVEYLRIIEDLARHGAEGVILGCTEIPLLVQQQHSTVSLFNSTAIHAKAAAIFALSG
ncbi:MAG: aspartate racemase [Anaerolinea sp.]|nr:aspartate racemase [Anaerolinea sp.]